MTPRQQLLDVINRFPGETTGMLTVDDQTFKIFMFPDEDRIVLAGVNVNGGGIPIVFGISDGQRVLFNQAHSVVYKAVMENDETVDMMKRTVVKTTDLTEAVRNELEARCARVCQEYVREQYGDAEPLASCTCADEDMSIAASYQCNHILSSTGSFESLQRYVNIDIEHEIIRDDKPEYDVPYGFYTGISKEDVIRVFMGGDAVIDAIARERINDEVIASYGVYAMRMVKWYRDRQELIDSDETLKTVVTINQAIKAFNANNKYANATLLTYTVRDDETNYVYRFRMRRNVLLRRCGILSDEQIYRVPGYASPRMSQLSRWRPSNIEEIRYVKHVIYKKSA